jgi:ankyrin repeat protein
MTPLHRAIRDGYLDVAKRLVELGANINSKNTKGWTPLHRAIIDGHSEFAKYLVEKGADIDLQNSAGDSPLDFAKKKNIELGS